ncbi:RhoGAP-domain-containing protein [Macrolepiota fuliginosa MF-IS2]|uniref:RhoGAP-domain-containing protein n=1 Tax=Macrolepiota fuliginosa MF-IS2 TaxID=1400762 RepID=A0A9P5X3N9_9AGAR|nr:RhoGAP-domain-containing protein [Macrolepiota fuliginosa MF-IS2]
MNDGQDTHRQDAADDPSALLFPSSPQPRDSIDSGGQHSSAGHWRDSSSTDRRDTFSTVHTVPGDPPVLVEPSFDEGVLRALCELDCGVPLLLDRIKQSIVSCREASLFFKKRAAIEDEYGRTLQKIVRSTSETYATNDGKAGSFVSAWQSSMRVHELMAENRLRFAQRLNEMSEELATLVKEVDKNRKQTKELGTRYERALQDSETITEKCKNRLEVTSEELERVLLQKEGESFKDTAVQSRPGAAGKRVIGKAVAKGNLLLKGKNPGNIQRQEDDIRARVSTASDQYRKAVTDTQAMRQEYFNFQLPRILRALKECADEIDLGTQYHLTRYAFLYESIVLSDGQILIPPDGDGLGLKATIETIDNRSDFKTYMQNYVYARGSGAPRGPRREGPPEDGFLPPLPTHNPEKLYRSPTSTAAPTNALNLNGMNQPGPGPGAPPHPYSQQQHSQQATPNGKDHPNGVADRGRPTFGVDLSEQMARDNVEVPLIMVKCCEAIERYGVTSQGIYRVSGTTRKVNDLRARLDKGGNMDSVDLDASEWANDINNVASVMKMWLRELPDPLLTYSLHQGFIEAAKIENDRLRQIRLHERVNDLPDPNYSTLKYFLGHLHRINQQAAENQMSMQNLAIVFGPTLFGQTLGVGNGASGTVMPDTFHQNLAIETILNHYVDIFVDEPDA